MSFRNRRAQHVPRHMRRNRISQQANTQRRPDPAHRDRFARFHGDASKCNLTACVREGRMNVIFFTNRDAAGGYDNIGMTRQFGKPGCKRTARMPHPDCLGAFGKWQVQKRAKNRRIHIRNLTIRLGQSARDFVTCDHDRDPQLAVNWQGFMPGNRGQRDVTRPKLVTRREKGMALRHIFAFGPDVHSGGGTFCNGDPVAGPNDQLLHDHGIGPFGHRRPGQNAHRCSHRQLADRRLTSGQPPGHRQCPRPLPCQICEAKRVSVHRCIIEQWGVAPCRNVF